jgi:hypothetical protein
MAKSRLFLPECGGLIMAKVNKTAGETVPATQKIYLAKTSIAHNGELYEVGEELELTDKEAGQLLAVDAVSLKPAPVKPEPAPEGNKDNDPA